MSYTAPPGGSVTLVFQSPYSKPPGSSVTLEFQPPPGQTISAPSLGDIAEFGLLVLRWTQFIQPSGISEGAVGSGTDVDYHRIRPTGFNGEEFGSVSLRWTQFIEPAGIEPEAPSSRTFAQLASGNYYPPDGLSVILNFGPLVTTDPGDAVVVDFNYPRGTIRPLAWSSSRFGTPGLTQTGARFLAATGFSGFASGDPTVAFLPNARTIVPVGFDAFRDFGFGAGGAGFIDFGIRRRYPAGFDASLFGTAFLSGGVRWVNPSGWDSKAIGTAFAAYRERVVEPEWFVATQWGTPQIGYHQTVAPTGFDASSFGLADVFDNSKRVYPGGFVATEFGAAMVAPRVRTVAPLGFWSQTPDLLPDRRWGRPEVYNLRQYVQQYFEVTTDDGGVFGNFNYVENRNRIIGAIGWRDSRFPLTHRAELTGRALLATGIDASTFGSQLVAYRIRTVLPDAIDSAYLSPWASIRNTAQLVPTSGFRTDAYGQPAVVNTRRYYDHVTLGETSRVGEPFVAFRERAVTPYYVYEGGLVGEPVIQHLQRYLRPTGIAPNEVGAATVEEHFTIIAPRWTHVERVGNPNVHNVTPELGTLGYVMTEWGANRIFNRWNYCPAEGFIATLWGNNAIEYRTKILTPSGLGAMRWGPNTNIRNIAPDPPSPQTIEAQGWASSYVPGLPGAPDTGVTVRGNVLFPYNDGPFTRFGTARIVNMAIGPCGGIYMLNQFGTASLNATQYVTQKGDNEHVGFGKPRLSPHTIWAAPAPQQAVDNHDGVRFHTIDFFPDATNERPKFGAATVTNRNRVLLHFHGDNISRPDYTVGELFGEQWVSNRRRWLYPPGVRHFRYGIPVLNGGGQVEPAGADSLEFGAATVEHYVDPLAPRYVRPQGLDAFDYGQPVASNWIRNLLPAGIDSTIFGEARVHPPEPIVPVGFRADVYGTTWVSNWRRYVEPTGIAPEPIDYVGGSFADRMRVSERHTLAPATAATGERFGSTAISNRVRTVKPTDEIGPAAFGVATVRGQSYVSVAAFGIEPGPFGNVDRWEAGKIKAHGDDMLQPGYGRVSRGVGVAGIASCGVGAPRLGAPVAPSGPFTQVIGDAVVSHGDNLDFVCGQLPRAIAVPGSAFTAIGAHTISH